MEGVRDSQFWTSGRMEWCEGLCSGPQGAWNGVRDAVLDLGGMEWCEGLCSGPRRHGMV